MTLKLILCAFGRHDWLYTQRGNLDSRSKTRRCTRCRAPATDGFLSTDFWGKNPIFTPLKN